MRRGCYPDTYTGTSSNGRPGTRGHPKAGGYPGTRGHTKAGGRCGTRGYAGTNRHPAAGQVRRRDRVLEPHRPTRL
ncbi:MAG: hypothetical protein QGH23_07745 [Dehalococcoidia bacterium]|nr:hypothetical protein [Dehalococcoidia bacterium]MDP6782269.1 hypothetical protein [Dehalococcoidia bacterium]